MASVIMNKRTLLISLLIIFAFVQATFGWLQAMAQAPDQQAAVMSIIAGDVAVRRVNTVNWITTAVEAIVGVGDHIRSNDQGRSRITFFEDGTCHHYPTQYGNPNRCVHR